VLALALGLTALLALVAAASRGRRSPPGGTGGGPSESLLDYLISAYLVFGVVFFVVILVLIARDRETLPTRRKNRQVRQLLQFAVVMTALFLLFGSRDLLERLRGGDAPAQTAPAPTTTPGGGGRRGPDPAAEASGRRFRWEPAVLLGTLAAGGLAVYLVRRSRRRELTSDEEMAQAMAVVLDDALADLRAEVDPRRAIIAAYARMERLLAAFGVPRYPSETPFEYLGRVLVQLRASAGSVFELTALFERAKFSHHSVDAAMKDEAIEALAAVRDELLAPGPEPLPAPDPA
jgi:hypothetical protein